MQGDQRHALSVAIKGVLIGDQRRVFHESIKSVERSQLHESTRYSTEFEKVCPALLPLHALRCEMRPQSGFGVDAIKQLRKRDGRNAIPQPADHIGNPRK